MRYVRGLCAVLFLGIVWGGPAGAATYYPELTVADFSVFGPLPGGGTYVYSGPKLTFASGDVVDFGTAAIRLSISPRYLSAGGAGGAYFLVDGTGGLGPTPLGIGDTSSPGSIETIACSITPFDGCELREFVLRFVIPEGYNGIQIAFQGAGLHEITPAVAPVPLPAAGLLLAVALGGLGLLRRWSGQGHRPLAGVRP